jgi:hypothetical protein
MTMAMTAGRPRELNASIRDVPMPRRMQKLPINEKGFPIPAFVAWLDLKEKIYLAPHTPGATRDFRVINPRYMDMVFRKKLCWICGEPLGVFKVFAIGPMCAVSRTTMEPPNHRDCVEYAVRTCPFMVSPRMVRNMKGLADENPSAPGVMIERNPGVYCLWETNDYTRFNVGKDTPGNEGALCRVGKPTRVDWWTERRPATAQEVVASIDSGYPLLFEMAARQGPQSIRELEAQRKEVELLYLPLT